MKREYWIGAGVLIALILGYLFLPIWQAGQRYRTAENAVGRCAAAKQSAYEWASLGFSGKREEWTSRAGLDCFIAENQPN